MFTDAHTFYVFYGNNHDLRYTDNWLYYLHNEL